MGAKHFSFTAVMIRNAVRVLNGAFFVESAVEAAQIKNLGWLLGTAIAGIITLLGLRPRKRGAAGWSTAYGFVFMFLSATAVLNFSWLGWWYIYLPLAGVSIGIAGLLKEFAEWKPKMGRYSMATGVIISLILIPLTVNHIAALKLHRAPKDQMYRIISEQLNSSHRTTYIWQKEVQALMRFDLHGDLMLPPETRTQYLQNRLSVVHMADHPEGRALVGYNIMPPFDLEFQPDDLFFRLHYQGIQPILEPVEKDVLLEELAKVKPRQRKPRTHL
jgi:hypothetical protein